MKTKFYLNLKSWLLMMLMLIGAGGNVWAEEYKLTITASDFNNTSYAANNNEKTSNAVCTTDETKTFEVKWTSNQVMKSGTNMQWQKNKGYIYNSTDLGTITNVTVTSTAGTFTTYYGTSEQPSSNTTVGNGYFKTNVGSATGTTSKIEVTFVIDEPVLAAPTFSQSSSYIKFGTEVELSATDGTTVYYTLDGTNPSSSSAEYVSPILVENDVTIKAIAVATDGSESPTASKDYYVYFDRISLTETLTFDYNDFNFTGSGYQSYTNKIWLGSDNSRYAGWSMTDVLKSNGMQMKASSGTIVLPTITSEFGFTISVTKYGSNGVITISDGTISGENSLKVESLEAENLIISVGNAWATVTKITLTPTTNKQDVTLSFPLQAYEATIGSEFTAPTATASPEVSGITYSSSNEAVATIDAETGEVTLVAAGTTVIAATFEGNDTYNGATAQYTLTVAKDPNANDGSAEKPYTVAEARAVIDTGTGLTGVYVKGIVSEIVTAYSSQYGNISYNISVDGSTTVDQLQAYRGKSFDGANFTSENNIEVGDQVVICGNLKKYNSTYELDANNKLISNDHKDVTFSFGDETEFEVALNKGFTAPELIKGEYDGTVTYASSNTNVATVATDGTVTLVGLGESTITASGERTSAFHTPTPASYTLTVVAAVWTVEPQASEGGTVSIDGKVITATPAEGYRISKTNPYTVSGTAEVAQEGNVFTVAPTSDCTVTINFEKIPEHNVVWSVNGTETTTTALEDAAVEFPAAPEAIEGKTFVGWVTAEIDGETDTKPEFVTSAIGAAGLKFYAVFANKTGGSTTEVTDELTTADLTATNTTYTDFSNVSKSSDAVYAGNSAKSTENAIQLRSKNSNSGIVSTTSGGTVKSVTITVQTGTNTIDIYGSNVPYTAASDLYATGDNNNQGTKVGSLSETGTVEFSNDYAYVGIRSNSGALYLSSVSITWEGGTPATYSGYCTTVIKPVAQIGDVKYATLADAVAAVPADGTETTITMIEDEAVVAGFTVAAGQNVVLELNGKTVSGNTDSSKTYALITNKGKLTIQDNTDTNKDGTGTGLITTYIANPDGGDVPGYASNTITNNGDLTVKSGKIVNNGSGYACYAIDNQTNGTAYTPTLKIEGGRMQQMNAKTYAVRMFCNSTTNLNSVEVSGGIIEGGYGLWLQTPNTNANMASLTITGGVLNARDGAALYIGGTKADNSKISINIEDGQVNGTGVIIQGPLSGTYGEVSISDGEFANVQCGANVEKFISGGTFGEEPAAAYLADAYMAKKVGDVYEVVPAVAKVGEQKFETFAEAIAALTEENNTITLLADIAEAYTLAEAQSLNVNLNGHALTVAAPEGYILKTTEAEGVTTYSYVAPVAKIGDVVYASLAEAVAAVPADGTETTITMIEDETIDVSGYAVTVAAKQNVVLELNGHQIVGACTSNSTSALIRNLGTLTIQDNTDANKDGSGNGKLIAGADPTWTWDGSDNYSGSYASNLVRNEGTLVVESGNLLNVSTGSAAYGIDNYSAGNVTINGGKVDAAKASAIRMFYVNGGSITVNDGIVGHYNSDEDYSYMGVQVMAGTNVNVSVTGGTIAGSYALYANNTGGSIAISDGTLDGYVGIAAAVPNDILSITGGTFTTWVGTWGDQTKFISGGTYNEEPDAKYIADGYVAVQQGDVFVVMAASELLATPIIFHDGGEYEGELTVAIAGEGVKYTLNGGAEQTYSAPFSISETTTVKAWAEKDGVKSNEVEKTFTIVAKQAGAEVADGYYNIKTNDGKFVNVAGRKTVTLVENAEGKAGTVIRVNADAEGVKVLRSQGVDLPGYAKKAMNYVPEIVQLAVDKLHAEGAGELLGETGLEKIMDKFNESFDYNLYLEGENNTYRIYGRTPSMKPVVDFYAENKDNVDAKLPELEEFINKAIQKVLQKTNGSGASILVPFSLQTIWERMGSTLTNPADDEAKFYEEVLSSEANVWNFAYQTAMLYWGNLKNHPRFAEIQDKLGDYSKYIDKVENIRPNFRYYIVPSASGVDFISQGNSMITDASTAWTMEPVSEFEVNFETEQAFNIYPTTSGGETIEAKEYYTTLYTDFAYTLPEDGSVKAYKVKEISDKGVAVREEITGTIPAQTPVLLKATFDEVPTENQTKVLTLTTEAGTAVTGNLLVGADALINEYQIKTPQVVSLFDMAMSILGESAYETYLKKYEHLMLKNAGTVGNKYFFGLTADDLKGVTNLRVLTLDNAGMNPGFHDIWEKVDANKAVILTNDYNPVKLFLVGDVNRDGNISIADVTALVNIILGKATYPKDNDKYDFAAANVNNDKAITISDVTALVNIILGK